MKTNIKEKIRLKNKINNDLYDDNLHKKIREKVGKCLYCGKQEVITESKKCNKSYSNLHLHHINEIKNDNRESNITVLCDKCHNTKAHLIIREPGTGKILARILNKKIKLKSIEGIVSINELQ